MTMDQTPTPTPEMPKKEGSTSGVIAIIVIVVLLALGGIYYLMMAGNPAAAPNDAMPTMEEVANSNDPDVQAAMTQGSSDALAEIEADLNATDLSGIDAELAELGL
jgi:flagellar basal body-associated protein FliL